MRRAFCSMLGVTAAVAGLWACGGEDPAPKTPCGSDSDGCSGHSHCDRVSVPARCVCDEAFQGDGCNSCAPGYQMSGGSCVALTVTCADRPCGARGECLDETNGSQVCVCETGYAGNFCANCVDGYQDNDGDGICQPSCGVANVACQGAEACSDDSGQAHCVCAPGFTGPTCDDCEPGYQHDPSGDACVPTCAATDFECSGTCVDTLLGARCECEPGHAGVACEGCEETHTMDDGGSCVAALPEDALLWTIARTAQKSYLGGLIPPEFSFFPVVPIADSVTDVAYDPASDVLYGVSSGSLVTIDQQTGELSDLIEGATGLGHAITRDPDTGLLFVSSDDAVWRADVALGEVTELSTPGVGSLAFDRDRRVLFGIAADGERLEIDPSDGSRRSLSSPLPEMEAFGLAVDTSLDRAYALGGLPELPRDKLARFCTGVAETLGVPRTARGLNLEFGNPLAAGETRVLEDSGADPPLIAYGSTEGTAGGGTLRVDTRHPDALVCVVTERETLEVVVSELALFELLIVVSDEPTVALTVESPYATPGAAIHWRAGGDATLSGPLDNVTVYTNEEWEALGLGTWSSTEDLQQPVLGFLDWRSGSSTFVSLDLPYAVGGLSWVGPR